MKIPEGWPTDAMQLAGAQAIRFETTPINKIWTANSVFKEMLAVAPTPPAPAGLDDIDIKGIALDCGFKLKPQPDGTEDLNPYVYQFAREILATMPPVEEVASFAKAMAAKSATPPAQEDEPVAEVGERFGQFGPVQFGILNNAGHELPLGTKLYTRPQSDKLRQAAEEVSSAIRALEGEEMRFDLAEKLTSAHMNLRKALEGE